MSLGCVLVWFHCSEHVEGKGMIRMVVAAVALAHFHLLSQQFALQKVVALNSNELRALQF